MLSKLELKRQAMHLLVGMVLVLLLYYNILSALALFLLIINGFLLSFICKHAQVPVISWFLNHFEREDKKNSFPGKGMLFLFIGSLLVIKLFEKDIALAAIMVLTLGDSFSHLFGAQFGRIKNVFNGKSRKLLEGTITGALAGFLGALFFVPLHEAFAGSIVAMIAEVIKIDFNDKTLDDNIVVPLVAGTVIFLMRGYVVPLLL